MKRLVFTLAMSLIVCLSFGQKKVVSSAKNEIKGKNPDVVEARRLIKEALANPETENQAETWFVAGQIENKQLDLENTKEILGQQPNQELMYTALSNILPYFEKAYQLDQTPDEKGKVKPQHSKDIKSIMKANRAQYLNAGLYYYNKNDYQKAFENFKMFVDMPNLPMMKGESFPVAEGDSTEMQVRYYAGLAAAMILNHQEAIAIFDRIKDDGFEGSDIYQRLAYEYNQVGDSLSMVKTLNEGLAKYPDEDYFLTSLINVNLNAGNTAQAASYLIEGIAKKPNNAPYYDVLGQVYESDGDFDKAIQNLKKALELDPENADFLSHLGRIYYNLGVEARAKADENTADSKQYEQELQKSKEYFQEAMPVFEKAFEINPDDSNTIYALRSIYYNLNMGKEFEKMDAIFNNKQ